MNPLINSFNIALASTAIAVALGVIVAFALVTVSPFRRFAQLFLSLSVIPILVPNYLIVSFWMEALGANGWLARLIAGGHAGPVNGLAPTIGTLALIYWSPVALACYFTLTKIDRAMIEAAELSLGKWRTDFRVVAPLLWPSVALSAALVFVLTFSNFSVPATFQVKSIQNEIYVQFNAHFDVAGAFLFAVPQIVAAVILLVASSWMMRRRSWVAVTARSSGVAALLRSADRLGVSRFTEARLHKLAAMAFLFALLLLSVIGPLLRALSAVFHAQVLWQTLVVSASQIWNSLLFSFLAATIVMALVLLIMNVGGASVRRSALAGRSRLSILDFLFLIPFVLPEVLIGIALIAIFNRPSLQFIYTSMAIVLIALTVRYFIIGRLTVSVGRGHIDPSLFEAAQLAGLPRSSMLWRIQLPLLSRWLFVGWWLTYLFCLADIGSLVLIYPPGCDTVSIRIFNLLHYGYDAQVSVLCLVMLVLGAVPLLLKPLMVCKS